MKKLALIMCFIFAGAILFHLFRNNTSGPIETNRLCESDYYCFELAPIPSLNHSFSPEQDILHDWERIGLNKKVRFLGNEKHEKVSFTLLELREQGIELPKAEQLIGIITSKNKNMFSFIPKNDYFQVNTDLIGFDVCEIQMRESLQSVKKLVPINKLPLIKANQSSLIMIQTIEKACKEENLISYCLNPKPNACQSKFKKNNTGPIAQKAYEFLKELNDRPENNKLDYFQKFRPL